MLFGSACLPLHHGTAFWCGFLFLIISFFFIILAFRNHVRRREVTEIGKCWCAASDIVSDHDDNSAKK